MIDCERWDVVTALFPFTDAAVRKPRPVLVLSNRAFNRDHRHVIGAMITTAAHSRWPSDHVIGDLRATGLDRASIVRWKLFTLPADLMGRRIGMLGPEDRAHVSAHQVGILS